jgi:acyl-CoA thioester hydrolase
MVELQDNQTPDYRFRTRVTTRFRDLDALRHVNHAVYFTILEEARLHYFQQVLDLEIPEALADWVLADIHCKYLAPLGYGDTLDIAIKTIWMRRSSFGAVYEMTSGMLGKAVARGEFVQVHVSQAGGSSPIPDEIRTKIEQFENIQSSRPA